MFRMTNTKSGKTKKHSNKPKYGSNADGEVDEFGDVVPERHHWRNKHYELPVLTGDTEVDDEDGSDTGTSFSLQDCMDEFRARRNRRIFMQNRHDTEMRQIVSNCEDVTEMELINQNMCNKVQERKCKPCKDGFCYCFTSDSGDGSGNCFASKETRSEKMRQHRKNRRHDNDQVTANSTLQFKKSSDHNVCKSQSIISKNQEDQKNNINRFSSYAEEKNQFTATNRLETSEMGAPLIHIIQELRENCVVSEVRVNKHKLEANQLWRSTFKQNKSALQTKRSKDLMEIKKVKPHRTSAHGTPMEPRTPTAPSFENIDGLDSMHKEALMSPPLADCIHKYKCSNNRRHRDGGRLLQKRLSSSNFNYMPPSKEHLPVKPPRISQSFEDRSSFVTTTTTLSVRDAERVLDEFLAKKGYTLPIAVNYGSKKIEIRSKSPFTDESRLDEDKKKSPLFCSKNESKNQKQVSDYYLALKDYPRAVHIKDASRYETTNREIGENKFRIDCNEQRIKNMLNCDSTLCRNDFTIRSIQAEPQQSVRLEEYGEVIGWKTPVKHKLDTVDGTVRYNLASNVENKETPVKSEIPNMTAIASEKHKFIWSEQFRNLSPWSNIKNTTGNIRSSSKKFLNTSKNKILRLVSPKKENRNSQNLRLHKIPHRHVAVQTSSKDLRQHSQSPPGSYAQSSPGSYHSPVISDHSQFDFSRQINSPTNKVTQRKLSFPLSYGVACARHGDITSPLVNEIETYCAFNEEIDKDVSLSKMSFVLSNIRATLEANDDFAVRTFKDTGRTGADNIQNSLDCVDGQSRIDAKCKRQHMQINHSHDPVYCEIDESSIRILEGQHSENRAGMQPMLRVQKSDVVYAQVNKSAKQIIGTTPSSENAMSLGKLIHESLKKTGTTSTSLENLPKPLVGEAVSYSSAESLCGRQLHSRSLNNVRVMEQNSPPKRQGHFSKSDLYLHRNEIFSKNLCKNEIILENFGSINNIRLQKINNDTQQRYKSQTQTLLDKSEPSRGNQQEQPMGPSYELPVNYEYDAKCSTPNCSNLGLNSITPPTSYNQSTPKKPCFTTKDEYTEKNLNMDFEPVNSIGCDTTLSTRYPSHQNNVNNVGHEILRSQSLGGSSLFRGTTSILKSNNSFFGLGLMQSTIRKSFRKGKKIIQSKSQRISTSLGLKLFYQGEPNMKRNKLSRSETSFGSNFDLDSLFSFNQSTSIDKQLTKVVHICRKLPELEASTEMVEAERLLLFSELRREIQQDASIIPYRTKVQEPIQYMFIDDIYLPIRADVCQDIFYNYFYIVTFECGGVIRSSQSAECQNGVAVFRDCGIEFSFRSEKDAKENKQIIVQCNIFMLRLRKVSTLSLESTNKKLPENFKPMTTSPSASSSISDEIVSRFQLQASFTLEPIDFIPFEYVEHESDSSERICLRACKFCNISLIPQAKSSNLSHELQLKGRVEIRFNNITHSGFLNVKDPFSEHNWNRRWCTLNNIHLNVWGDINHLNEYPLLRLDLRHTFYHTLKVAPPDLCARPRAFCMDVNNVNEVASTVKIFFAADTQDDLNSWLERLSLSMDFVQRWFV